MNPGSFFTTSLIQLNSETLLLFLKKNKRVYLSRIVLYKELIFKVGCDKMAYLILKIIADNFFTEKSFTVQPLRDLTGTTNSK